MDHAARRGQDRLRVFVFERTCLIAELEIEQISSRSLSDCSPKLIKYLHKMSFKSTV
jgi:hypothetical protein